MRKLYLFIFVSVLSISLSAQSIGGSFMLAIPLGEFKITLIT